MRFLSLALALALSSAGAQQPSPEKSVVRVNTTMQAYNLIQPWQKAAPGSRLGLGAVIPAQMRQLPLQYAEGPQSGLIH